MLNLLISLLDEMVPEAGLEPARCNQRGILNLYINLRFFRQLTINFIR